MLTMKLKMVTLSNIYESVLPRMGCFSDQPLASLKLGQQEHLMARSTLIPPLARVSFT